MHGCSLRRAVYAYSRPARARCPRRPWQFSVEVSTPALHGPLRAHTGGAFVVSDPADAPRWHAFTRNVVPPLAALKPVFVTLPCKEPYFTAAEARLSSQPSPECVESTGELVSTTQACAQLLAKQYGTPVMLTLSATIDPQHGLATATAAESCLDHVARARRFEEAVALAVGDFLPVRGGSHVLVVRGDDYSRPQRQTVARPSSEVTAATDTDTIGIGRRAVVSSGALVQMTRSALDRHSRDTTGNIPSAATVSPHHHRPLLAVAGYPQGHITQRRWQPAQRSIDGPASDESSACSADACAVFLAALQSRYASAAATAATSCAGVEVTRAERPAYASLVQRVRQLAARLEQIEQVAPLWTTPSSHAATTRRHNIVDELVKGKLQACWAAPQPSTSDVLVMTQVVFTAQEFIDYEHDVLAAVADMSAAGSARVAAGVAVPPVSHASTAVTSFLGLVAILKVIPSHALITALEAYRAALSPMLSRVRAASPELSESDSQDLAEALDTHARACDEAFCRAWAADTVALIRALRDAQPGGVIHTAEPVDGEAGSDSTVPVHVHFFPVGPRAAAAANIASLMEAVG